MAQKTKKTAKTVKKTTKQTAKPRKAGASKPASKTVALRAKKTKSPVKKAKASKPVKKPAKSQGAPERIRDIILKILDDRQAEQIVTVNLRGKSSMADYLIIASGRAARQIAAIADFIRADLANLGLARVRTEGEQQGDWVLVDAGDVIVHLFRPEVRRYYNIEQIYGAKSSKT